MNKAKKDNIKIFTLLCTVFYLLFSFVNINFNPLEWGVFSRFIFGIGFFISFFKSLKGW